jgi:hypothetical protein
VGVGAPAVTTSRTGKGGVKTKRAQPAVRRLCSFQGTVGPGCRVRAF